MVTYTYTGKLTDFGEQPFPDAQPRLFVTPEREAFGPTGLLSTKRIPLPLSSGGNFSAVLVASIDTSPEVRYILRCEWFEPNGPVGPVAWSDWTFTAAIGGGPIKDMVNAPASVWFVGPPWPATPVIGAFYLDRTGDQPYARYTG